MTQIILAAVVAIVSLTLMVAPFCTAWAWRDQGTPGHVKAMLALGCVSVLWVGSTTGRLIAGLLAA